MDTNIKNRLDAALNSSESEVELINLVHQLKAEGWSQLEVYDVFETYMFSFPPEQEAESDVVCEVVERIYGWCGESWRLFPKTLDNDEIRKFRESRQSNKPL